MLPGYNSMGVESAVIVLVSDTHQRWVLLNTLPLLLRDSGSWQQTEMAARALMFISLSNVAAHLFIFLSLLVCSLENNLFHSLKALIKRKKKKSRVRAVWANSVSDKGLGCLRPKGGDAVCQNHKSQGIAQAVKLTLGSTLKIVAAALWSRKHLNSF